MNVQQLTVLRKSLLFLHVEELKNICLKLSLPDSGKKGPIIARIVHFLETGKIITLPKIPKTSCAQKGKLYPLHPQTLIVKDAYKNDLVTRNFFKHLIGDYFHFTAFGIDWINERWLEGNPPTYQEFAEMWKAEYARRKKEPVAPKEEWQYINFTQKYIAEHPNASRDEQLAAWERERQHNVQIVLELLKK